MSINQKTLVTMLGCSLVVLLGNSAFANEPSTSKGGCDHSWSNAHSDSERHDQRMNELHSALKLSAAQETAWSEFAGKMKPSEMVRHEYKDWSNLSTPDRLDRMLDGMKAHEKSMTEHVAVVKIFYNTLNIWQKNTFDSHFMNRHHMMHHHHDRDMNDKK